MWNDYWKLGRDPFLGSVTAFVPLPMHLEAVARLVHSIETGERFALVTAEAGLGKSRVLARALEETRSPVRRVAILSSPTDGAAMLGGLAQRLGRRVSCGASRAAAWNALGDAVRLCRFQRLQVVLAIDDCQDLYEPAGRLDLDRLIHIDPHPEARLTVIQMSRITAELEEKMGSWELAIRLAPLTRSETEHYVTAKLAAEGRDEPTFTPRAIVRLHALSEGVPRGIDRLASLALMAGGTRGLEIIGPELIDGVARECRPPCPVA